MANRSKSRQKAEESSKSPKSLKSLKVAKVIGLEELLPKYRSSVEELELLFRALTVFRAPLDFSQYYIWSNYHQDKANGAADALSRSSSKEPN